MTTTELRMTLRQFKINLEIFLFVSLQKCFYYYSALRTTSVRMYLLKQLNNLQKVLQLVFFPFQMKHATLQIYLRNRLNFIWWKFESLEFLFVYCKKKMLSESVTYVLLQVKTKNHEKSVRFFMVPWSLWRLSLCCCNLYGNAILFSTISSLTLVTLITSQ